MTPVVYQNRGGTESLWAAQTVMENYPNGPTAVRWYQFNVTGGTFPPPRRNNRVGTTLPMAYGAGCPA